MAHDLGDDRELRLPGAGDDGHHPVADAEAADAGAGRDDLAGQLEAGQLGRGGARRGRVVAVPLHDVAPADAGGPHSHEQLTGAGLGIGVLAPREPPVDDGDRVHRAQPRWSIGTSSRGPGPM